ncbi:MAG: ECF transporter S component [Lachnospiraceae bacterium]
MAERDINILADHDVTHPAEHDSTDFLKRFYASKHVNPDSPAMQLASDLLPAGAYGKLKKRMQTTSQAMHELKGEGNGSDLVLPGNPADARASGEDELFIDPEDLINKEKKALSRRTKAALFLLILLIPLTIGIGVLVFRGDLVLKGILGDRFYFGVSLFIMFYSMIPFFMVFEGRKPQARELIILSSMVALACAGRAAFFMVPSFKPLIAIVIISAIAFGAESGFLVGAMTMLVSNFLFGQGPWTPWQMFTLGLIGFITGLLNQKGLLPSKRLPLCIYGFLVTIFIYGGIMNPAAMFMSVYGFSWQALLAYYISGIPVDLVHATSTFIFLWIGARPLLEKLTRIKVKYGLIER